MPLRASHRWLPSAILAVLALGGSVRTAGAVARNWTNAAGGSAATSTNWSPAAVPGAADNLIFPLATTYAVSFPVASVPVVVSHDYRGGSVVTLTADGTHSCSNSFGVGQLSTAGVNITSGTFGAATVVVGSAAGVYGRLTLRNGTGFPVPPSPAFVQTDSLAGSIFGNDGLARLEILGGSSVTLTGSGMFANTASSVCTLTVAGRNTTTLAGSTLKSPMASRAQVFGNYGDFVGSVDNAGSLQVSGPVSIGVRTSSTSVLRVGASSSLFAPSVVFEGAVHIGDTGFTGSQAGQGVLELYKGSIVIGGPVALGDPDGTPGSVSALRVFGGSLLLTGGITRVNTTWLQLGGTVHVAGGPVDWGGLSWNVTSTVDAPILWIANGQACANVGQMRVGRYGTGLLRVARPGTAVSIGDDLVVGDSLGGSGVVEMDSSATLNCFSPMMLGRAGAATVSVRGGAQLSTNQVFLGYLPGSSSDVTISGAGSLLSCSSLYISGNASADGGPAVLRVDSSGVFDAGLSSSVVRAFPSGTLDVRHGGLFRVNYFETQHQVELEGGTIETSAFDLTATSTLHGRGTLVGTVLALGTTDLRREAGTFGRLQVDGAYTSAGVLHVGLGRAGAAPACDTLSVSGFALLGDTLVLEPDPSFLMIAGDAYRVVRSGTQSGTFPTVLWRGGAAADSFDVTYLPDGVVVTARSSATGVGGGRGRGGSLRWVALRASPAGLGFALDLPDDARVRVALHDVSGRQLMLADQGLLGAGSHVVTLPASALPSGVYFARAVAERAGRSEGRTVKVALVR